ncbi:MAG: hypothetical protein V4692_07090, partial [Bdellovibrionota bacterium]
MARVAFFTERIDDSIGSFAFELMTGLADQQHDLRVYSTYREGEVLPETNSRLQIIRPFRKWNWLELGYLVPLLMEQQPEILHFIQPHDQTLKGFTNAMAAIPVMGQLIQKPVCVVSLYDFKERDLDRYRTLLFTADAVTVSNASQARAVEHWMQKASKRAQVSIVPLPSSTRSIGDDFETSPMIERFICDEKVVLIPGDV